MSKQDRTYTRTASALEQKYNFGQSFADVYGLVSDARKAAEEASKAIDELNATLTPEEIFNRLTNYGEEQGIYREDGKIYINATYIKSGKIAAEYIDAEHLEVYSANIKGTLIADGLVESPYIKGATIDGGTIVGVDYYGSTFNIISEENIGELSLYGAFNDTTYHFFKLSYFEGDTGPIIRLDSPAAGYIHLGGNALALEVDSMIKFNDTVQVETGNTLKVYGTLDLSEATVIYPEAVG